MRAVVAVLLAGCYSPTFPNGVACDPAQPVCPGDQRCVQTATGFACSDDGNGSGSDAGPHGGPGDRDGDGVLDADDNCVDVPNPDQADEDRDGLGDACDPCPPFSDPTDSDGDGVPDACDPHPQQPGDHLVFFEGFAGGLPAGWQGVGMWTVDSGTLKSTATATNLSTLVIPFPSARNQTISTIATIVAETGNTGGAVGIVDGFDMAAAVGMQCGGLRAASEEFGLVNAANGGVIGGVPYPFTVGQVYHVELEHVVDAQNDRYNCSRLDADGSVTLVTGNPTANPGPFIGLRNRTASATFPWVMVVSSQ